MRILHVITGVAAESGGPTHVLRQMTADLVRRGHDVTVLTTDSAGAGRRIALGTPTQPSFSLGVRVEMHRSIAARTPHLSPGHALAAWGAGERHDIAHVHGLFAAPISLAMAAFRARALPYVLRPCGMLDRYSLTQRQGLKRLWLGALDRPNLLGAARVQASTEHEASAVRGLMPTHLHDRVVVLPQGVATPEAPTGRRLHARPYLLFLSRIARKKGLPLLIDAFARMAAERPELDLVLAGPDEHGHRAEIEARVLARALGGRVRFVGAVRGADKSDWFAGAEAFVLPSDDENFGVVVVEAAHLGTPIVVSDQVGLAPTVHRLDAGLVSAREPELLADALRGALEGGRERFAGGLAALASAFQWEVLGARLEALYREVLSADQPAQPSQRSSSLPAHSR